MAGVSVSKLIKNFGQVSVLREVSFEAEDGEFIALVGPSGCGKSTLLRCIAGLEAVHGGTISIGGRVVNNLEPKERDAAMVFQNYALYPHMSVHDNMGFSLKLRGAPAEDIKQGVDEAARILGLTNYLDRLPRQLSGGQRQRVAMGRAIVRKPSVFLFDEPLSNLDAALRVQMRAEIRSLHKRLGVTSIYVTHDQVEAMTMADKIVVMQDGIVEQVGAPLELYDHPANSFVATFIGSPSMNLIEGRLQGEMFIAPNGQTLALSSGAAYTRSAYGQPVLIGLRPEHISVSTIESKGAIASQIIHYETTGNVSSVICDLLGAHVNVAVTGRLALGSDSQIFLTIQTDGVHMFEAATGKRLRTH
jgi:multiple sugar transport system ATP-binding protein